METKSSDYNCPQIVESELTWKLFLYRSILYLIDNGLKLDKCKWTDWCKKFNVIIVVLYKQPFVLPEIYEALENTSLTVKSPSKKAATCISNYRLKNHSSNISFRKSTIHGVKGETHDATMLISNATRNGTGTHWSHWIGDKTSEAARFAYVASSRPKHVLVWCVKKLNASDQKELESLGFEVLSC